MEHIVTDTSICQLRRELRVTRILCLISSVLTLCLLAGGVLLFGRVRELAGICRPIAEKVSQLDVGSLNDTLDHVNASLEAVNWEQVADALGELDVEALNSAIEGLDTEELTESLKNINDAAEKIRDTSEKLGTLFNGIFNGGR